MSKVPKLGVIEALTFGVFVMALQECKGCTGIQDEGYGFA